MYPPRSIRRFLLAAAAPVLAVALLAGCGGGAAETTNDADPVTESNSEQIDTQGSGTEPRFVVGFRGFLGAYTSPSVMAAMGSLSGLGNSSAMEPSDR